MQLINIEATDGSLTGFPVNLIGSFNYAPDQHLWSFTLLDRTCYSGVFAGEPDLVIEFLSSGNTGALQLTRAP